MDEVANDFYEEDEPREEIIARFNAAPQGLTGPWFESAGEGTRWTLTVVTETVPQAVHSNMMTPKMTAAQVPSPA